MLCPIKLYSNTIELIMHTVTINKMTGTENRLNTRACTNGKPPEMRNSPLASKTCMNDAIKLWNSAPKDITKAKTLYKAKTTIKEFVKSLPV